MKQAKDLRVNDRLVRGDERWVIMDWKLSKSTRNGSDYIWLRYKDEKGEVDTITLPADMEVTVV